MLLLPKSDAKATNNNGNTALMYAVLGKKAKLVELLLPKSDTKATDNYGFTDLTYVRCNGWKQKVGGAYASKV